MDRTELFELTTKIRRSTRLPDVIALCDEAERLACGVVSTAAPVVSTQAHIVNTDCPVCNARRFAKAAAQRRWRNKESLSANGKDTAYWYRRGRGCLWARGGSRL
jgi:hypothetical protein